MRKDSNRTREIRRMGPLSTSTVNWDVWLLSEISPSSLSVAEVGWTLLVCGTSCGTILSSDADESKGSDTCSGDSVIEIIDEGEPGCVETSEECASPVDEDKGLCVTVGKALSNQSGESGG